MPIDILVFLVSNAYSVYVYETMGTVKPSGLVYIRRVTKSEYKNCKRIIEVYKERYADAIPEYGWEYGYLSEVYSYIKNGMASSVEEAVKLHEHK